MEFNMPALNLNVFSHCLFWLQVWFESRASLHTLNSIKIIYWVLTVSDLPQQVMDKLTTRWCIDITLQFTCIKTKLIFKKCAGTHNQ